MDYLLPPWNHQLKAIENAWNVPEYGLLFEQGCGKTSTSINILRGKCAQHKILLKTLVICPVIVLQNWKEEFAIHSKIKNVHILHGSQVKRLKLFKKITEKNPAAIFITNFEAMGMKDLHDAFRKWQPQLMIVDESQRIKVSKNKRSRKVYSLGDRSNYRMILTGTPILNSPMDIYGQFRFLDKGETFGRSFTAFKHEYFIDKNKGMPKDRYFPDWVPKPRLAEVFNEKIYKKCMRVTKDECLDLPPLVRQEYTYEMQGDQLRCYNEMAKHFVAYLNSSTCVANRFSAVETHRLCRFGGRCQRIHRPRFCTKHRIHAVHPRGGLGKQQ